MTGAFHALLSRSVAARLAAFSITLFALLVALQLATRSVANAVHSVMGLSGALAVDVGACAVMLLVYRTEVSRWERRRPEEISPGTLWKLALAGTLLGIALFTAVYGILWSLRIALYVGRGNVQGALLTAGSAAVAAVSEEVLFRGAIFRILEDRFGTASALAASAVLFGLAHAANPGATLVSTAAIALEAGVLLGVAYTLTRRLWFPIGIHAGWNFTEGGVFGTPVSGGHSQGLIRVSLHGPALLTGGSFGPEASVVAVTLCAAAALVIALLSIRWHRWRKRAD